VTRIEDDRILTGRGRYVDDVHISGLLHAAFVRSPVPHARIRGIDLEDASSAPGVVAVFCDASLRRLAADIEPTQMADLIAPSYSALARDKVRMVGDPVAMIVADSRYRAEDAAELVNVEYELLEPIIDVDGALADGAALVFEEAGTNLLHHRVTTYGDPDAAFGCAAHIIAETFEQHRHANVPMEGHGGVASYDAATDELDYYASHQNPHALRVWLAHLLGHPANRLRVQCGDVGGAFGQKGHLGREDVAVCAAARSLGRPVKWIEDRNENLVAGGQAREERVEVRAAVDDAGGLLGLDIRMTLDQGSYPMCGFASAAYTNIVRALFPAAYRLENLRFEALVVATNKATYVPYRGPWEVETWVRERVLDIIARTLALDPIEVRFRNLLTEDEMPGRMCTGPELIGITQRRTLTAAVSRIGYADFRRWQTAVRGQGRHVGIGVANYVEPAPAPPSLSAAMMGTEAPRTVQQARARLEPDGTVTVFTSQQPHGQGHETTFAQLAADELGLDMARFRVAYGDTRDTPFNLVGTGGSRAATLASGAVIGAVGELREKMLAVAARLLEVDPADLEWRAGQAVPRGVSALAVPVERIAQATYTSPAQVSDDGVPGLEATSAYGSGEGTWSQATHCCTVEIDVETGKVAILRYLVVEDCGELINPAIVDGQIRGGVAQGIGAVLLERAAYDEDGQFRCGTLMDYLLPTATDIPRIEIVHIEGTPGFRGVGEGGAIGSPAALTNAIEDALSPFGIRICEQYLPPGRIVELVSSHSSTSRPPA
jgi:carbon-monoxide dehydrogenase large subunit